MKFRRKTVKVRMYGKPAKGTYTIIVDQPVLYAPCDWDQESYCVRCDRPAAHRRLDCMAGETPVYEMVCCLHAEQRQ